ncbi:VWA domain-containing protein [Rhodoferax sp.]|uniref:nitric oxide reductase activation protein NorD n=1 Tax=Rhodoferax sp. TaxID=50421 RepID=UPI0025DBD1DE|nr:VWA domain-containing protein [Rhodoferax sp.]
MEEMIGRWWHQAITKATRLDHPAAAVQLQDMQKTIGIFFRAAGGPNSLRFTPASLQAVGGQRHWAQKLAGSGQRADTAQLEPDVLALPATLAVFDDAQLNRDLYLWLAMLSACWLPGSHWIRDNLRATQVALAQFPGFAARYQGLLQAHLAQRPKLQHSGGEKWQAESAVQAALREQVTDEVRHQAQDVAPVWLWLSASTPPVADRPAGQKDAQASQQAGALKDKLRRRTQATSHEQSRNPMVLPFRAESIMSWSEMVHVNRSTDDEEDGNALNAANDMDKLSIAPDGQTLASRVKFDLDLPSSSTDDTPVGPGIALPEWDYRRVVLQPAHCLVQVMQAQHCAPFIPSVALRLTAKRLRRRLETLRDAPRAVHGQDSGDDIDLDAWVRFHADQLDVATPYSDTPSIYTRRARLDRSLATLLLADLSLSTDAYATEKSRVIDVIRDALFVFGEALHAAGDPFAIWGFSSVRRQHVRMQHLKTFAESWSDASRARVGAIKPGYYTRIGAAIRHATLQLADRPERKRLLMLLTDGKPNDLDVYEGRYGLEDTRQAVREAHAAGLIPFCVTIDEKAHDYLPMLFGQNGYAMVHKPQDLVRQLTQAWATLSRR